MEEEKKKKKAYCKPEMHIEEFTPNEYIAACYKIWCKLPNNNQSGTIYLESNGQAGLQRGRNGDTVIGRNVTGCGREHKGVQLDAAPTANSYCVQSSGFWNETVTEVFSWEDDHGWHSAEVSSASWETNPNAS